MGKRLLKREIRGYRVPVPRPFKCPPVPRIGQCLAIAAAAIVLTTAAASAEPLAAPGNLQLRNDLQLLNDRGFFDIPMTAWPVAWRDVQHALSNSALAETDLDADAVAALRRVRGDVRDALATGSGRIEVSAAGASDPRIIRTFEDTPREDAEFGLAWSWLGERFTVRLDASAVDDPHDGDTLRPDGTYLGMTMGNWMLSAGWQERWWGPGRDGSLIKSTNARPPPGVTIRRLASTAPEWKWLRWLGPWTLASFMEFLDDERAVDDAWLWGFRMSFRPVANLEIGLSRAAQWCGEGRRCDVPTFLRVLNGNDNRGANVDAENEPGNQLGGIDVRWALPRRIPVALYMQWIAEDTRKTGAQLRLWMQQAGIEYWGNVGGLSHRTHLEFVDTNSHLGALGEGSAVPNVAYNHDIFRTGFRYLGRSMGHGMDNDAASVSLGSTLLDAEGNAWSVSARQMRINRNGDPDPANSLSPTPQDRFDVQISHTRQTRLGRIHVGVGYSDLDDDVTGTGSSGFSGFLRWHSL